METLPFTMERRPAWEGGSSPSCAGEAMETSAIEAKATVASKNLVRGVTVPRFIFIPFFSSPEPARGEWARCPGEVEEQPLYLHVPMAANCPDREHCKKPYKC